MSNEPDREGAGDGGGAIPLDQLRAGPRLQARNSTRDALLARELELALGPWRRLKGLLGTAALPRRRGLLIRPCNGVHTLFMRYAIDVLFLDADGRVLALRAQLAPWRATALVPGARAVLELAAGRAAETGTRVGDRVVFEPRAAPTGPGGEV